MKEFISLSQNRPEDSVEIMDVKLIIAIIISSILSVTCQAETWEDIIAQHREWVTANTPNPVYLSDSEVIIHAADAITMDNYEDELCRIIHACGKWDAFFRKYADEKKTIHETDFGFKKTLNALKKLRDVAYLYFPEDKYIQARVLLQLHNAYSVAEMNDSAMIILKQCRELLNDTTPKMRALRMLCDLILIDKDKEKSGENPLMWNHIVKLENEVLKFYESGNEDDIVAYMTFEQLAVLKGDQTNYYSTYRLSIASLPVEMQENFVWYPTKYNSDNARYWYDRASAMVEKLFGPGSTEYMGLYTNIANYILTVEASDLYEPVFDSLNSLIHLHREYTHAATPMLVYACVLRDLLLTKIASPQDWEEYSLQEETMNAARTFFDKDSDLEIISLVYYSFMNMQLGHVEKAKTLAKSLHQCILNGTKGDKAKEILLCTNTAINLHYYLEDAEYRAFIEQLVTDYIYLHKVEWKWINTGKSLVEHLSFISDKQTALAVSRIVISDMERLLPSDHIELACVYSQIIQYMSNEQIEECISLRSKTIDILEKHHNICSLEKALLGQLYSMKGDTERSIELSRQAYEECISRNDTVDIYPCGAIYTEILLNQDKNNSTAVKICHKLADGIMSIPYINSDILSAALRVADYYYDNGNPQRAIDMLIHEKNLSEESGLLIKDGYTKVIMATVSGYMYYLNDYDAALRLIEEGLAFLEGRASCDGFEEDILQLYNMQINIIFNKGVNSQLTTNQVSEIFRHVTFYTSKLLAGSGNSVDMIYGIGLTTLLQIRNYLHLFSEARNEMQEQIKESSDKQQIETMQEIFSATRRNFKTQIVDILQTLLDNYPQAYVDYRTHTNYYALLSFMAEYYYHIEQDYTKTDEYYRKAIAESELHNPTSCISLCSSYFYFLYSQQKYEDAMVYLKKHQELTKGTYKSITDLANDARDILDISLALGRQEDCIAPARDFFRYTKQLHELNFDFETQNEREAMLQMYGTGGEYVEALVETFPNQLSADAYNALLYEKNLLLRSSERIRRSVMSSDNQELKAALDSLQQMRNRLKMLPTPQLGAIQDSIKYWTLSMGIENLERRIARESAQYRDDKRLQLQWSDVASQLRDEEAAIEFVVSQTKTGMLILRKDCDSPRFIPLTETESLFNSLAQLSSMPAEDMASLLYEKDDYSLYQNIWEPAEEALQGIKTVYFSPTGYLSGIAIEAIRTPDGMPLMDKYDMHRLTTTAILAFKDTQKLKSPSSIIQFGGICYSQDQKEDVGKNNNVPYKRNVARNAHRGADSEAFCYLPQTLSEVETIHSLFATYGISGDNNKNFTAAEATEERIRSISENSPNIIHLATHGFYLADYKEVDETPFFERYPSSKYFSMMRSGLAFASANDAWIGDNDNGEENDGILTASEISTIDFSASQLVVLSACETALGTYTSEGVYGLQRGFKQAGVNAIVASLWSVSDESTSLLMKEFYNKWLQGKSIHQSLKESIMDVRKNYPQPYYWAAFILLDGLD